jgi:hypothetical protein
MYFF